MGRSEEGAEESEGNGAGGWGGQSQSSRDPLWLGNNWDESGFSKYERGKMDM